MNKEELVRKRNIDLSQKLDDLKFEIQYKDFLNSESNKKAKALISELETLREEFVATIAKLKKSQNEYDKIIRQISLIKNNLENNNK